jgi:hypothetical protein
MTWTMKVAAGLALVIGVGACGNLTSGGVGELEVFAVADDPPEEGAAAASTSTSAPAPPGSSNAMIIEGTITFEVGIRVLSDDGDWVDLTDGFAERTLRLEGTDEAKLATGGVPAGRYRRARMPFRRIEANVLRGLNVDGEVVVGMVPVNILPGAAITVERALDLEVRDGETEAILMDLNVQLWLRRFDRMRRHVRESDFSDAVRMRSR